MDYIAALMAASISSLLLAPFSSISSSCATLCSSLTVRVSSPSFVPDTEGGEPATGTTEMAPWESGAPALAFGAREELCALGPGTGAFLGGLLG